jgi:nuclear pore complex protein Nup88
MTIILLLRRTVSIGSQIYFNESNVIRTRRVSWHPYSDAHLGILSSDSVFRYMNFCLELYNVDCFILGLKYYL